MQFAVLGLLLFFVSRPVVGDSRLAILLEPEVKMPEETRRAMEEELGALLAPSGVSVTLLEAAAVNRLGYVDEVITVVLRGGYQIAPGWRVASVAGTLGSIREVDGEIQPRIYLACQQVASHLALSMRRYQLAIADRLLGRALGRVVVHELLHWAKGSAEHGMSPLSSERVSAQTLIEEGVELEGEESEAIRLAMEAGRGASESRLPAGSHSSRGAARTQ